MRSFFLIFQQVNPLTISIIKYMNAILIPRLMTSLTKGFINESSFLSNAGCIKDYQFLLKSFSSSSIRYLISLKRCLWSNVEGSV